MGTEEMMKEINLRLLDSLAGNLWPTPSCLSLFVRHVARLPISHARRRRRGQLASRIFVSAHPRTYTHYTVTPKRKLDP